MFCRKCGEKIEEGNVFCPNCGERTTGERIEQQMYNVKKEKDNQRRNRIIGIVGIAIILVIAVLVIVKRVSLFNGGYEKVIENYVRAIQEEDGELLRSLYPSEVVEYTEGSDSTYNKEEMTEICKEIRKELAGGIENYQDIEYDIVSAEEIGEAELENLNKQIEDYDFTIRQAYYINLKMYIPEKEACDDTCCVVKIHGKWYMLTSQRVMSISLMRALEKNL